MTNATFFKSTTVDALDAEIDAEVERILADETNICPECGGFHPAPVRRTNAFNKTVWIGGTK